MKARQYTEEQIIAVLREGEAGPGSPIFAASMG
jgi:hypothetical protein